MVEFLGWIGFFMLVSTLLPFVLRRLRLWRSEVKFFTRCHHSLALASLTVLTLHGLFVLIGKRGWQWGKLAHLKDDMLTGVISWSVLLAVVVLALFSTGHKPLPRTHCLLAILLVIFVLYHIS